MLEVASSILILTSYCFSEFPVLSFKANEKNKTSINLSVRGESSAYMVFSLNEDSLEIPFFPTFITEDILQESNALTLSYQDTDI